MKKALIYTPSWRIKPVVPILEANLPFLLHTLSALAQRGRCWFKGKVKLSMAGWKGSRLENHKGFGNNGKKSGDSQCGLHFDVFPRDLWVMLEFLLATQVASRGKARVLYTSNALWRWLSWVICGFNCWGAPGTVRKRQNCAVRRAPGGPGSLGVVEWADAALNVSTNCRKR